ncbi:MULTISPECIES: alpha/beta hydrolase family protein [Flavobacterium]|uniref:Alpha/beta hydrolase family protein n=1 Tax=Flavobacterium jumunjinense TaxID=998845 RepID=A0ABV5GLN9_9FLAO|nr:MULTISPECIES: acyl-CoA thioester hydrolase/BAAT C-terminal domain-containing protein [Flavobacterium]
MKSKITIIIIMLIATINAFSQSLEGVWHGITKKPDNKEILFVFLFEEHQNSITSKMAIPTFDVMDIKPKTTIFKNGKLTIDGSNIGIKYEGVWNENTSQIEGTYTEGSVELVLNLVKGNPKMAENKRPQEPTKPYPYYEEEVKFKNTDADITLSGTFTRPIQKGKYPVVILISGSGRHDRDGSAESHRPFLVISDYLTRNGIAVLRYDDRGFRKSSGDFSKATTADFAKDVVSAVSYLKSRNDINVKHIGLIGHSEGGIIAPLVANQSSNISFIVTLAATAIPGSEVAVMQSKILRPFPVPNENDFEKNVRIAIEIASSNLDIAKKRTALIKHNKSYLTPILKSLGASDDNISKFIDNETETVLKPWNKYFFNYNPANEFEKLKIPMLSLNGSMDKQVDATINQNAIRKALIKGGNKKYKIIELENLNHLFQECKTGNIDEYKELEQTIAPIALNEVYKWINEVTSNNKK